MHKNVLCLQPGNKMDDVTKLLLDGKIGTQRCKANNNKQSHNKIVDPQCATNLILDPKKMLQRTKQLIQKKRKESQCCSHKYKYVPVDMDRHTENGSAWIGVGENPPAPQPFDAGLVKYPPPPPNTPPCCRVGNWKVRPPQLCIQKKKAPCNFASHLEVGTSDSTRR